MLYQNVCVLDFAVVDWNVNWPSNAAFFTVRWAGTVHVIPCHWLQTFTLCL